MALTTLPMPNAPSEEPSPPPTRLIHWTTAPMASTRLAVIDPMPK